MANHTDLFLRNKELVFLLKDILSLYLTWNLSFENNLPQPVVE